MGAKLMLGTGRKKRSHQRDLAEGGGGAAYSTGSVMPFNRDLLLFSRSVVSNSLQPHDCSMPGFPGLHYLLEFAQTHVH